MRSNFIYLRKVTAVGCFCLGVLLIESAFEHFILKDEMTKHYLEVGFTDDSRWLIGGLQLVAGICLLFKRTRLLACVAFTVVMALAVIRYFVQTPQPHFPKQALWLCILSSILATVLFINRKNNASS